MRVAHIWRQTAAGGAEGTSMRLYQALDKKQVQFDFIVENTGLFIDRARIEALGGRVFLVPPMTQWRQYRRALTAIFARERYAIVHAHLNELSVFPLKIAKAAGIPVRIAHAHSTAHWRDFAKTFVKKILRPGLKDVATHYLAVSVRAAEHLFGKAAVAQNKVAILYNALDLTKLSFNPDTRAAARAQLGLGNNQLVVGHIGRMTRQKNQALLLRAFAKVVAQVPDARLLLVGDGPLRSRFERLAARLHITAQVIFVETQADVVPYYHAMDVFVLPSLYEGLPGVGVEAQANGLPCVFATTITREVQCHDNVTWLPLKGGATAWAQAILQQRQTARVAFDLAAAQQKFNITEKAVWLAKWYQQILGGHA